MTDTYHLDAAMRTLHRAKRYGEDTIDREQAQALLELLEWQPIETAPRDGTRIDLWVENRIHEGVNAGKIQSYRAPCSYWTGEAWVSAPHFRDPKSVEYKDPWGSHEAVVTLWKAVDKPESEGR